jgi:hypothetical protein
MGLTTWKDAPRGKIQKFDVVVAKNYLTQSEMAQLQRLVSAYLDIAEDMALRQIPMTMEDWETRLGRFIEATDRPVLQDAGRVTTEIATAHAEIEFEKYRIIQDRLYVSDFDAMLNESGLYLKIELVPVESSAHNQAPSIQQPKHPKRHLRAISNFKPIRSHISIFQAGKLLSRFIGSAYFNCDLAVEPEISFVGILHFMQRLDLAQKKAFSQSANIGPALM